MVRVERWVKVCLAPVAVSVITMDLTQRILGGSLHVMRTTPSIREESKVTAAAKSEISEVSSKDSVERPLGALQVSHTFGSWSSTKSLSSCEIVIRQCMLGV